MPLVQFTNVEKTYRMGSDIVHALAGVSFSIEEGEFVSILGPSGSGKSTLMHLLGFLDQPTSGVLRFDGRELSTISTVQRALIRSNKIGFVFQAFNLLPRLTVLRNTLLPLSYARKACPDALARAER